MSKFLKIQLLIIPLLWTFQVLGQNMIDYQPTIADSSEVLFLLERNTIGTSEQALSLSKLIEFKRGQQVSLEQLVSQHERQGNVALCLRYALESIDFYTSEKDEIGLYKLNCTVGNIYFKEKLFGESITYFRKSERINYIEATQKIELWEKLGFAYHQNNEADSALHFYQKALDFHANNQAYEPQVSTLKSMASIFEKKGDCQGALKKNLRIQKFIENKNDAPLLATTFNNIGYNYHCLNDFENAILNFEKASELCERGCDLEEIILHTNLAVTHFNIGNFEKGMKYLNSAIEEAIAKNNAEREAELYHLKATVFYQKKDLYQAQNSNQRAMQMAKKNNYPLTLEKTYRLAALLNQDLYEFESALEFYRKYLELRDSLLLNEQMQQQKLQQQKLALQRSEKEIKLLLINQKVQDLNYREAERQREILRLENDKLALETRRKEDELSLLRRDQEIQQERLKIQELEAARSKQELLQAKEAAAKDRELAKLQQEQQTQQMQLAKNEAQEKERLAEIENLKNRQEIDRLEIQRQKTFQQIGIGTGIGMLLILGLILFGLANSRKKNRLLAKQNEEIEQQKAEIEKSRDLVEKEREKSEALLLNILPFETAKELKETGAATPKIYENVSVLFTDFIGFTQLSEKMSPDEIIEELNTCFLAFDEIIEKHGLEKIKTIGDAYMCAAGVPKENPENAKNAVLAGLEMQQFIENRRAEKMAKGTPYWQMRLGIHTGNVVAGVVGSKKFAYDIWGDTVNTASRIENGGLAGKVNISADTYELVKTDFKCEYRGTFEVKNKGEMKMYLVGKD